MTLHKRLKHLGFQNKSGRGGHGNEGPWKEKPDEFWQSTKHRAFQQKNRKNIPLRTESSIKRWYHGCAAGWYTHAVSVVLLLSLITDCGWTHSLEASLLISFCSQVLNQIPVCTNFSILTDQLLPSHQKHHPSFLLNHDACRSNGLHLNKKHVYEDIRNRRN